MDVRKFVSQTDERFVSLLKKFLEDSPAPSKHLRPAISLHIFGAYMDDILAFAAYAAISTYHEQLREELQCHGIDIGPFIIPDEESDSDS